MSDQSSTIRIKTSDNIPFEIQSDIIRRFPVKSLIRFRSVSKSWKSLIESSEFIACYRSQQQHLLVRYLDAISSEEKYVSIVDDDATFPQQLVSVPIPPLISMLNCYKTIGSSHGLLCLYKDDTAVIWNPSISKVVAVPLPLPIMADDEIYRTVLGFGVCRETIDPKIVKIDYINRWGDIPTCQVQVFTLSTGAWRSVSSNLPRDSLMISKYSAKFGCDQVVVNGCVYWLARELNTLDDLIVSFDLTSEEFGEVMLPDGLARSSSLFMYKLRESLVVIRTLVEDNQFVDHVWMLDDDVDKIFTKLFAFKRSEDHNIVRVRGFRKASELLVELQAHPGSASRILAAYEPSSKSICTVWISGRGSSYHVFPYMETLLLL